MSRRLVRISLTFVLLLSSEVWAIGLGDIKLDSALNEPLRADIILLSATPEELAGLTVELASPENFARYGIDRPFYLQEIEFKVVRGGVDGSIVQIRSRSPMTEPFLTFLIEATWPSGRLLREYTVLLDPPTYTPPAVQQPAAVTAPSRPAPSDSGQIQPRPQPQPQPQPQSQSQPRAATPAADNSSYDTAAVGDVTVQRGDTLWGIAARARPDSRLSMNQTMVAIYESNRDSFDGNINRLKAGSSLRIPSADEIFQITRNDAFSEVKRQNEAWGGAAVADSGADETSTTTRPSLVLAPPDEEPVGDEFDETATSEPVSREQEIENRIDELESADVPDQPSLIEVRDNELAELRQELANIRGEVYEPPVDETIDETVDDETVADGTDDEMFPHEDDVAANGSDDEAGEDDELADDEGVADSTPAVVDSGPQSDDAGIVDKILGFITSIWGLIAAAILLVLGLLIWFMRRGDDDDYEGDRPWEALDEDEMSNDSLSATGTMRAPTPEEAIVVVEQDTGVHTIVDDEATIESEAVDDIDDSDEETGKFGSLEDTFSSETAVNLDQSDPIAEADFHMAYGLYDQAADLINGALESEPSDKNLMSKLCEIYFVWGNRDAFVDAATRLKMAVGDSDNAEWNKIVIMGQQIAADHDMFAGAEVGSATNAVDLDFDHAAAEQGDVLDMDFGTEDSELSDIVDLGAEDETHSAAEVDFAFADTEDGSSSVDLTLEPTSESPTIESEPTEQTAEMPSPTVETPTIEEQFEGFGDATSELPSLDESMGQSLADGGRDADATAEINLEELDLSGVDGEADSELDSLYDMDDTGTNEALVDTGLNEAIGDLSDETGELPKIGTDDTGIREKISIEDTGIGEGLNLAVDETGQNPSVSDSAGDDQTGVDIDQSLLDATGLTQVLTDDMAVETGTIADDDATLLAPGLGAAAIADDAETLLAPLDGDDDSFDFAKTEALPPEAFDGDSELETTAEKPAVAETDVDLDLDDLTAALQVSDIGDTVEQTRDEATVEQPRPTLPNETAEVPTIALGPDEMTEDLNEARTMTEVGTKLDLARAYVDMGDPAGARSILEEVLDEGDDGQKQQAQQLLDSLPS